jgi:hypothetical protein
MIQSWKKLGQIFKVDNNNEYLCSHASNPLPVHLFDDVYRIYYSGRNVDNKSSVGYVDIDIVSFQVLDYPKEPISVFGKERSFYSHGISLGGIYEAGNSKYILFMGWQVEDGRHWRGDIGRLLLENNKLELSPADPFLTINQEDKVSLSYACVIHHEGIYKMWYGSTINWSTENGEMLHVIKYATSTDGDNWERHGLAIPYELGVAQAFSKPSVIVNDLGYHMWYSYRSGSGEKYRIGYSFSVDGVLWERKHNDLHITVSDFGWDSEMICYPCVFRHKNNLYMLYNGNNYGIEGFGLAVLIN